MSACEAGRIGEYSNVGNRASARWKNWYDPCEGTATHRISSGCVHEHVVTWDICDSCAESMAQRAADGTPRSCVACRPLHGRCPVIVAIKALEPAS